MRHKNLAYRAGYDIEDDTLGFEVVDVTAATVQNVVRAYERWGKGIHPAGPNVGDCYACALAKERGGRLLHVGEAFSQTDLDSA